MNKLFRIPPLNLIISTNLSNLSTPKICGNFDIFYKKKFVTTHNKKNEIASNFPSLDVNFCFDSSICQQCQTYELQFTYKTSKSKWVLKNIWKVFFHVNNTWYQTIFNGKVMRLKQLIRICFKCFYFYFSLIFLNLFLTEKFAWENFYIFIFRKVIDEMIAVNCVICWP